MFNKAPFKRVISMPKFYSILISMLLSSCELSKESLHGQSVVPPQTSNTSFAPYMSKDFSGNPVMSWIDQADNLNSCLLYTSPSPRDRTRSRMPSSA